MPQAVTGNWRTKDVLFGKGSLHSQLRDATVRTRLRATRVNEGEKFRLQLIGKVMAKYHHAEEERNAKIVDKVKKSLKELEAYKQVLCSYRVDNFRSMELGFLPQRDVRSPKTFKRYQLETRILNCGFSIDTLQSEVTRKIDEQTPAKVKKANLHKLLHVAKRRSDFLIDRRITNEAMKRERFEEASKLLNKVDNSKKNIPKPPAKVKRINTFITEDGESITDNED